MPVKKTQQLDAFAIQYAPNMAIFYLVQENGIAVWERSFTTVEKAEAAYDNGTLADQYVDQLNRLYGRHLMAWRVNWRATPSEAYLARLKWREDEDRAEVEAQKAVDRLAVLFNLQHQLNARIGIDPTTFQDDEAKITEWLLNYTRALQQEVAELIDCTEYKWWRRVISEEEATSYVLGLLFGDLSVPSNQNHRRASLQTTNYKWAEEVIIPMLKRSGLPFSTGELTRDTTVNGYDYPNTRFVTIYLKACPLIDEYRKGLTHLWGKVNKKYLIAGLYDSDGSRIVRHRRAYEEVSVRLYSARKEFLEEVAGLLKHEGIEGTVAPHEKKMFVFQFGKRADVIFRKKFGFLHPDKRSKEPYFGFDRQNARVEVVDCFHFLISIAQVLGMSAEDVFQAYLAKNKVNHNRQDAGYTEKDHADSKHI